MHTESDPKEVAMTIQFEGTHLSCTAPHYPMPPMTYKNNRMLFITFKTSPDLLRALVPEPLAVNPAGLVTIYVGALNVADPVHFSYHEAGIMIPASYMGKEGNYMPVLYLDQALPIMVGREIWGFPKFQAELGLEVEGGMVRAHVIMNGVSLIDATLHMSEPIPHKASTPLTIFLLKSIPSVTGSPPYDVNQLTTAVLRDSVNSEVRPGMATLHLRSTPSDPLNMIPVLEIVSGVYVIGGFVLDYGEVIYDYLTKEKAF
jgi:acetoacetate decarboxylase